MRVRRIVVREAPGLPGGVRAEELDPRLTVIVGPNASGKSTLARTLRGALWPETAPAGVLGEVEVEADGTTAVAALRWGRVTWEPRPPALPGPDAGALARLDLPALLAAGDAEHRIAAEIAVELAGGYDVAGAAAAVQVPDGRSGELQRAVAAARDALRAADNDLEALAGEEDRLPELEAELGRAKAAQESLGLAEKAVELAGLREELAEVEVRLPALPGGLDRLRGDEADHLETVRERLRRTEEELAGLETQRREAGERLDELRFPEAPPSPEALAAWSERARRLDELAREAERLRRELAAARAEAEAAGRGLFDRPERPAEFDRERLAELEQALDQLQLARAALKAQEVELRIWQTRATEADPGAIPKLDRAARHLRRWLAEQRPAIPPAAGWLAAAAGAVLAGAAAALRWPGLALAAGAGLLGAGIGWLAAVLRAGRGRRPLSLDLPEGISLTAWTEEAVREALDEVERKLAEARLAEEAARRARETEEIVEEERHRVQFTFSVPVGAAAMDLGLDPELPLLPLLEQARRLERWHAAEAKRVRTEAELRALEEELETARAELDSWLAGAGCEPIGPGAGAAAAVEAVARRVEELATAEARLREAEESLTRARERARRDREELAGLWERTGVAPGDEAELLRRLEALPRWKELVDRRAALLARIAPLEEELGRRAGELGLDLERLERAAAEARRDELATQAERADELAREIGAIQERIAAAAAGDRLEAARAAAAEAALAVASRRDRAMEAALTRLVLERARDAVAREHAPAVLARARGWLTRFTRGAFRLEVDPGGGLYAVDTAENARRELGQLSDGTRIHLLLAARLAALESMEGTAGPLPLVLDEALSTTDPARFREIARALAEAAAAGRQVLYLTADPTEAAHWQEAFAEAGLPEPPVVELAPVEDARSWRPPAAASAPPPEPGEDAAAYAARLGLPAPDPFAGVDAWPVVWLLADRLEAAHRLLDAGIARVGGWRELQREGAGLLEPADDAVLAARAALAGAALEAWRVGRGRPVTWEDVAASGAVSDRFEAKVRELLQRHGRDPERFLAEVRGLKGFRGAKADLLQAHLEAAGVLDPRDPLEPDAIVARALATARPALDAAGLDPAGAARWLRALLEGLG